MIPSLLGTSNGSSSGPATGGGTSSGMGVGIGSGGPTSSSSGGVGGSSLNRRRGTSSSTTTSKRSTSGSMNNTISGDRSKQRRIKSKQSATMVRYVLLILLFLCVAMMGVAVGMFLKMTGEEKQSHVERIRSKVEQARAHLLRGRQVRIGGGGGGDAADGGNEEELNDPNNNNNNHQDQDQDQDHHKNHKKHHKHKHQHHDGQQQKEGENVYHVEPNVDNKPEYPYPLQVVAEDYDIASHYQPLGGYRFPEYLTGEAPYYISADLRHQSDTVARSRRYFVKRAMQHAWQGYESHAFGADELLPQSGGANQNWGGQGITLVDALDTLWLMDMKDEFWRARDWVRDHLSHENTGRVSVFETTIRDLGGLLAAFDLSHDQAFLDKALDLGRRLLQAFDGSDTGIPFGEVSLRDGAHGNIPWAGGNAILAEFGTMQVENRYLSKMTQHPEFAQKHERVFEILHEISPDNGLFPIFVKNSFHGAAEDVAKLANGVQNRPIFVGKKLTFGAMGDSVYEYMLKIWLQGGKTEHMYREMYDKAIQGMHDLLLHKSTPSGLTYIADLNNNRLDHKMDHLVCFMGGSLALGAYTDPLGLQSDRAQRDLKTARALTYTCYQMYARMKTGISPEFVQFVPDQDLVVGRGAPHYLLRPEVFESFFILHQLTGDPIYREWGWECFQSIEKYCKTVYGYGELSNVNDVDGPPRNKMESFFLAETLKYLYLLQDPDTEIDVLHKHVFNTEAHPLRIFPVIDHENGKVGNHPEIPRVQAISHPQQQQQQDQQQQHAEDVALAAAIAH